jgi:hypothetical protein
MQMKLRRGIDSIRVRRAWTVGVLSYIAYGYGLFPGRIYKDSATMFQLMSEGQSTDQWSALYFWFISLISNKGEFPFLSALICAALLYISLFLFVDALPIQEENKEKILVLIIVTPFVGVFGFTIGHDVTATSGILLLLRALFLMKKSKLPKKELLSVALGVVLSSTSILGCAAVFGFSLVLFFRNRRLISILSLSISAALTLGSASLLSIERSEIDLSIAAILGDLKCIAQHPDSKIEDKNWEDLIKLAPKEAWLEPKSCTIADHAFFALEKASRSKYEVVKTWISIARDNPQIMLQARIQRASNVLPPVFFRSPPNMFDTSYSNPVGASAGSDLQIAPDLFKTSVDLPINEVNELPQQKILETAVLLPTFILNQRSDLWGWGGFWLTLTFLLIIIRFRNAAGSHLVNLIPLFCVHWTLIFFSPSPSPRYVFASILVGIVISLNFAVDSLRLVRAKG